MPSSIYLAVSAAALLGFAQISQAQTNITSHACASGSEYTSCNRKVADDWSSCIRNCNGNGNCIVDCGCSSHQAYINCMAQTCWNQVRPFTHSTAMANARKQSLTRSLGLLMRIPTLRPTILRHLPQRLRTDPLLASPRQRPKPLLLRFRQSHPIHPHSPQ
jgi:hypothetical protein